MPTKLHQKYVFTRLLFQSIKTTFSWCFPVLAWSGSCPDQAIGVHETRSTGGITYVSIAKATALSDFDGSIEMARSEARILAKRQLIERLNASSGHAKNISGAIDISTCVAGHDVFSTMVVTENSVRQASKLHDAMTNSLIKIPTPTP